MRRKKAAVLMNRRFFQLDLLALIGAIQERHDLRARAVRVGAERRVGSTVRHVIRNRPVNRISVERVGLHIGEVRAAARGALEARYRNVTLWPRVQVAFGANVVSVTPFVMPFSIAQATVLA